MTCPSSRKVYFAVTPSRQPNVSILFDGSLRVVTTPRKPKAGDINYPKYNRTVLSAIKKALASLLMHSGVGRHCKA